MVGCEFFSSYDLDRAPFRVRGGVETMVGSAAKRWEVIRLNSDQLAFIVMLEGGLHRAKLASLRDHLELGT